MLINIINNQQLINANCLDAMQNIEEKSINAIICDLPYGKTKNKWDSIIDLDLYNVAVNRLSNYRHE